MIDFMQTFFGSYAGTVDNPDFQYIGAVAIFLVCLWGFFRLLALAFGGKLR